MDTPEPLAEPQSALAAHTPSRSFPLLPFGSFGPIYAGASLLLRSLLPRQHPHPRYPLSTSRDSSTSSQTTAALDDSQTVFRRPHVAIRSIFPIVLPTETTLRTRPAPLLGLCRFECDTRPGPPVPFALGAVLHRGAQAADQPPISHSCRPDETSRCIHRPSIGCISSETTTSTYKY